MVKSAEPAPCVAAIQATLWPSGESASALTLGRAPKGRRRVEPGRIRCDARLRGHYENPNQE